MFEFTTNQWAIIALVFILGWLLGLFTLAGGRKWRKGYEAERAARIAAEEDRDRLAARVSELDGERDQRIALEKEREGHLARATAANSRIAELERDRPAAIDGSIAASVAAAAAGKRDDLARIYGIGRSGEIKLNELGIHRYAEITSLSASDEAALEGRLGVAPGTIADERWREQAEMLRNGDYDEHARKFA